METELTVREAAAALGLSTRTLRRHLQAGALSSSHVQRGKQEVRVIQAAELVRFAQAQGYTLRQPGEGAQGQTGAQGAATYDKQGQEGGQGGAGAPGLSYDTEGQTGAEPVATYDKQGQTVAQAYDIGGRTGADREGQAAARIALLEAQLAAVTQERDFLREIVLRLSSKALPAAGEERQTWWQRVWGGPGRRQNQ